MVIALCFGVVVAVQGLKRETGYPLTNVTFFTFGDNETLYKTIPTFVTLVHC